MEIQCFSCHKKIELNVTETIGRKEVCPYCYSDIHSCKFCSFYDTSSYNECREPMADRITEKEKANFCDYFKINLGANDIKENRDTLLNAAEALFKKK